GKLGVLKTLIHVVEKPASQQWIMQKCASVSGNDFQWILVNADAFEAERVKPPTALVSRRPFTDIGFEPASFVVQTPDCHFLIDSSPQRIECSQRWQSQDVLSTRLYVSQHPLYRRKPIGSEEHDRQIPGDSIKTRQVR